MRNEHRNIQQWIKQRYSRIYRVSAEIDQQNRLPDPERHWYQPDVILRDFEDEIRYIIEVENDPMRKAVVGASILADASIYELDQKTKPTLIFVVYMAEGIKQMSNFESKLAIARKYCSHLRTINIYSESDFKSLSL